MAADFPWKGCSAVRPSGSPWPPCLNHRPRLRRSLNGGPQAGQTPGRGCHPKPPVPAGQAGLGAGSAQRPLGHQSRRRGGVPPWRRQDPRGPWPGVRAEPPPRPWDGAARPSPTPPGPAPTKPTSQKPDPGAACPDGQVPAERSAGMGPQPLPLPSLAWAWIPGPPQPEARPRRSRGRGWIQGALPQLRWRHRQQP